MNPVIGKIDIERLLSTVMKLEKTKVKKKEAGYGPFFIKTMSDLPDNFPIQQKDRWFCKEIFSILFKKQPSLLLSGEAIWQSSDSSLSIELHAQTHGAL